MNLRCWLGMHEWDWSSDVRAVACVHCGTWRYARGAPAGPRPRPPRETITKGGVGTNPVNMDAPPPPPPSPAQRALTQIRRGISPAAPAGIPVEPVQRLMNHLCLADPGMNDTSIADRMSGTAKEAYWDVEAALRIAQTPAPPPPIPPAKTIRVEPLNMGVPIPCPGSVIWLTRDAMEWNRLSLRGPYPGSPQAIAEARRLRLCG